MRVEVTLTYTHLHRSFFSIHKIKATNMKSQIEIFRVTHTKLKFIIIKIECDAGEESLTFFVIRRFFLKRNYYY